MRIHHDEALALLVKRARTAAVPPGQEARIAAAERHAQGCAECWATLGMLYELQTGEKMPVRDGPDAISCEEAEGQLHLLVGIEPEEAADRYPKVARHLGRCLDCREAFVDLWEIERAAARGEFGPSIIAVPQTTTVPPRMAAFVERLAVRIRGGIAAFVELPGHLIAAPLPAPAGAWRADRPEGPRLSAGERVTLHLGSAGLKVDVVVEPQEAGRVRLSLTLSGQQPGPVDVSLREVRDKSEPLLAAQTARPGRPFVLSDLRAGRYILEIHEGPEGAQYRVELKVDAQA